MQKQHMNRIPGVRRLSRPVTAMDATLASSVLISGNTQEHGVPLCLRRSVLVVQLPGQARVFSYEDPL